MGEILDHGFGRYEVFTNNAVGLIPASNQVTRAEFVRLEHAWQNIQHNIGMRVTTADLGVAGAKERAAFLDMTVDAMTRSHAFRNEVIRIGEDTDPAHTVGLIVASGANATGVIGDSFADDRLDMDDLRALPVHPEPRFPSQLTRDEVLLHVLAERHANRSFDLPFDRDRDTAHEAAIHRMNEWRSELGRPHIQAIDHSPDPLPHHTAGSPHDLVVHFWDGRSEDIVLDGRLNFLTQLSPFAAAPTLPDPFAPLRVAPPRHDPEQPTPVHKEAPGDPRANPSPAPPADRDHHHDPIAAHAALDPSHDKAAQLAAVAIAHHGAAPQVGLDPNHGVVLPHAVVAFDAHTNHTGGHSGANTADALPQTAVGPAAQHDSHIVRDSVGGDHGRSLSDAASVTSAHHDAPRSACSPDPSEGKLMAHPGAPPPGRLEATMAHAALDPSAKVPAHVAALPAAHHQAAVAHAAVDPSHGNATSHQLAQPAVAHHAAAADHHVAAAISAHHAK